MSNLYGFLGPAYLWVKAAHVTFVIFWLAGLFLLPRFYVYHQETAVGSPEDRAWIEREARVTDVTLNPPQFEAERTEAHASNRIMYRDTDQGLRYLVKRG